MKTLKKINAGYYVLSTGRGNQFYYAVKTKEYWKVGLGSNEITEFKYFRDAKEFILSKMKENT